MKFSIKDFFSKCDKIRRKHRIWSDLLKKSLMENFILCAVKGFQKMFYLRTGIKEKSFLPLCTKTYAFLQLSRHSFLRTY